LGFDVRRGGGGRTIQGCPKGGSGLFPISSMVGGGGMDRFWNDPIKFNYIHCFVVYINTFGQCIFTPLDPVNKHLFRMYPF
jgi:hypothetical protein